MAIDLGEAALRLGVAVVLGGAIGLNRNLRRQAAGLRTHALVALGAALITYVASRLPASPDTSAIAVSRAIQGIVTGIGFVGGGVILHPRQESEVRGLTTATSIWVVAALGLACGAGACTLAGLAAGLTLLILGAGRPLERLLQRLLGALGLGEDGDRDV